MNVIAPVKNDKTKEESVCAGGVWDEGLTEKRRFFVLTYCTDEECFLNGTLSYKRAYPACKTSEAAAAGASKLLRIAKVKQAVRKLLKLTREIDDELASYKILKTCEQLAFYNPADIITDKGELLKPLKELGSLAICIEQLTVYYSEDGSPRTVIKLADRHKAMNLLVKYLNLVRPEQEAETAARSLMPVMMITDKTKKFQVIS